MATADNVGRDAEARHRSSDGSLPVVVATIVFVIVLLQHVWMCDDAFITLRAVRNVLAGYGPRWNIHERVQAYTHPLWMLVLVPAHAVSREPYFSTMTVSLVTSLAAFWILCRRFNQSLGAMLFATGALVSSKSFMDYSTSGLENPLTHLLYVVFVARAMSFPVWRSGTASPRELCFWAALLVCNRMDTILLVLPILALSLYGLRRQPRELGAALVGFTPVVAWQVFSLLYYGFWAPNTAYAKLGAGVSRASLYGQGLSYYVSQLAFDPVSCAVIVLAMWSIWRLRDRVTICVGVGMILYMAYIVRIGGDFMAGRFFSVLVVASVVVVSVYLTKLGPVQYALAPALLVVAAGLTLTPRPTLHTQAGYRDVADGSGWDAREVADERGFYYKATGLLNVTRSGRVPIDDTPEKGRALPPNRATPLGAIGVRGYFAPASAAIIDIHGLSDPLIARLPVTDRAGWRIGHFIREIPAGYLESINEGRNRIADPTIARLYDRLVLITRAPVFDARRLAEVVRFNLGLD